MSTTVEQACKSYKRRKLPFKCTLYADRSDEAKNMTAADIMIFKRVLHSKSRLFSVLPGDSAEIEFVETSYGAAPKGSLLSYQLSLKGKSENPVCELSNKQNSALSLSPATIALYRRQQEEGYDIPDPQYITWLNRLDNTSSGKMVLKLPLSKHACDMLNPTKRISLEELNKSNKQHWDNILLQHGRSTTRKLSFHLT